MANQTLFRSTPGPFAPAADTCNEAGGRAYSFEPRHALAQFAMTGCLNDTFYASAEDQLAHVLRFAAQVEPAFVAKAALFARTRGFMKDVPALLCAHLAAHDGALLERIFPHVIDNARMLRTFVQIVRSGAAGRRSLGTRPRRLVRRWLAERSDDALFQAAVGQSPSLADVIKMVHPRPATPQRAALYRYLIGRDVEIAALPPLVQHLEAFKAGFVADVPDVPFQMLTALPLMPRHWAQIARSASWQTTRMNLNTFARHGVFEDPELVALVAGRLRAPAEIRRSRALPYQLLAAYRAADGPLPGAIAAALQDALELATANVPRIDGKVFVLPDVSGSMHSPVTGHRRGATTAVRCTDVAALVTACVLRSNPEAEVLPFSSDVVPVVLNPRDSVMTNAELLASLPAGGTNCSAPLRALNERGARGDLVIYVSDQESWLDAPPYRPHVSVRTETISEWSRFKARNPGARLVCIDLQPYETAQTTPRADILNVGGFSDTVFEVVAEFARGRSEPDYWLQRIEEVLLP